MTLDFKYIKTHIPNGYIQISQDMSTYNIIKHTNYATNNNYFCITKEEAIFTKVYPQPLSHISRITRAYSFSQLLRRYPQFTTCNGHPSCSL